MTNDYANDASLFDDLGGIESRVASVPSDAQGALRTALNFLYRMDGPINLPRPRLLASMDHLSPAEVTLVRWLHTRTNGSERKRYGAAALFAARNSRYRCETCGYSDVPALNLDHVAGRSAESAFACLCANCRP